MYSTGLSFSKNLVIYIFIFLTQKEKDNKLNKSQQQT